MTPERLQAVEDAVNNNGQEALSTWDLEQYRECLISMWRMGLNTNELLVNHKRVNDELNTRVWYRLRQYFRKINKGE